MSPPVLARAEPATARWKATIYYRSAALGSVDVEHGIEELSELHEIVERGPDWNTIAAITIHLDRKSDPTLTIEQAAQQ
jgi:hypothetical protein